MVELMDLLLTGQQALAPSSSELSSLKTTLETDTVETVGGWFGNRRLQRGLRLQHNTGTVEE